MQNKRIRHKNTFTTNDDSVVYRKVRQHKAKKKKMSEKSIPLICLHGQFM